MYNVWYVYVTVVERDLSLAVGLHRLVRLLRVSAVRPSTTSSSAAYPSSLLRTTEGGATSTMGVQQHLCNRRKPSVEMVATLRFFVAHDVVAGRRLGGAIGSQRAMDDPRRSVCDSVSLVSRAPRAQRAAIADQ